MPRRRRTALGRYTPRETRRRAIQAQETDEQRHLRLLNERTARAESRAREPDARRALRLQSQAARTARTAQARARQSDEQRALRLQSQAARTSRIRARQSDEQRALRLQSQAVRTSQARARETRLERALRLQSQATRTSRARVRETSVQRARRRSYDRISSATRRQRRMINLNRVAFAYDCNEDYNLHPIVDIGSMNQVCQHCNALKYRNEASGMCCSDGKVALPHFDLPPDPLLSLVKGNDEH